ncbi:ATP-binding protein [Mucilaginibacter ginkgonis]|uniref:histidine kinase n=1 Tax=Mucilaginibacter ginkgonis TaxID=2682091 RepID=A0A6I4I0R7_9SPHI|nr:ATP-binding protein [Mucilaginibacter ginkgonis]QQL48427.1 response regulator [Mucilaginibacter ginkgonis]
MATKAGLFNFSLKKIINPHQSVLDQARVSLLYYALIFSFFAFSATTVVLFLQSQKGDYSYLLYVGILINLIFAVLFKYLTATGDWKSVSHVLLIVVTAFNISNLYIISQVVDIVCIQLILIVILASFYTVGQRYGMFYSMINLVPTMAFMVLRYMHMYLIPIKPEAINPSITIMVILINFILIIFIHSHFYSAFLGNIKQLWSTSAAQSKLNSELEVAIQKAEQSTQAKSDFLSTMSHEIRTPLNAVIGMTNLLMMGTPREDQKENLEILKFSATNLLSIVNDVLDFNKIESGKISFESIRFNIAELLDNICGAQIIKANEKGLSFQIKIDEVLKQRTVLGDPTRITQVIFNLVSNAIKFTQKGNIWVTVTCLDSTANRLLVNFSVKDTGIGIKKDNMALIFEAFAQESMSTTRQYGGTGLGLAIVKRLLDLQHIDIVVNSKENRGSEFSFKMEFEIAAKDSQQRIMTFTPPPPAPKLDLNGTGMSPALPEINTGAHVVGVPVPSTINNPIPPVQEPVAAAPVEEVQDSLSHVRVLIAEDNMVNVMLMKKLLSKWGITPVFAENGAVAVEEMQKANFDIVLMDLQMPVLNGFEATSQIREMSDPKKSGIPIIALTASALLDIKDQVYAVGMNDYVSKPFKPEELKDKMLALLSVPQA